MDVNTRKKQLKKTIVAYLLTCQNKRCLLKDFWNEVARFGKTKVSRKQYGVKKMHDLLPQFKDILVYDDRFVSLRADSDALVAEVFRVSDSESEDEATVDQATSSSTPVAWGSGVKRNAPVTPREVITLDSDDESDESQSQSTSSQSGFIPFTDQKTTPQPMMQGQPSHQRYGLGGSQANANIFRSMFNPTQSQGMLPLGSTIFLAPPHLSPGPRMSNPEAMVQSSGTMGFASPATGFASPAMRNVDQSQAISRSVVSEFPKPRSRTGPPAGTKITDEPKEIIVQPVQLPRGARLTSDQINHQVIECIELLSSANEHVSIERVENMILQKYQVHNFQALNLRERYFDRLPAARDHSLLLGKTNAYIQSFVRSRSLCTLYEFKECCREFHPEKKDFEQLKLGPLQKMPMIYEMFKFPVDEYIPEISTVDVLECLNNFLDKYNKWTTQTNVEDFMKYLMEVHNVTSAYSLGIRLRSLPLAIQMLKKSKRDAASTRKTVTESLKEILNMDVQEAFSKFQATILQTGADGKKELRLHYMNLPPEIAIREIMSKFELLAQIFTTNTPQLRKIERVQKHFENFVASVLEVQIPRMLLHLSVCMSNLEVQESATQFIEQQSRQQQEQAEAREQEYQQKKKKQPPTKVELIDKTIGYLNRCLGQGALHLSYLLRIEAKLLEDFVFQSFHEMGYGSFLEFVLGEPKIKKILEECSGTVLGSSSGGHEAESLYKPSLIDLLEFICQSRHAGITQNQITESVIKEQFRVTDIKFLGHGNISRLCSSADKPGKHSSKEYHAHYEAALCGKLCPTTRCNGQVGIQGSQSRETAIACLTACPLLGDMAEWSHWSLVFQAQHGRLREFVEKHGGYKIIDLKGGCKTATSDFMGLEVEPGKLLKISSQSTPQVFFEALELGDPYAVAGHLVSLIAINKGVDGTPLALLANHMKTKLISLHARSQSVSTPGGPPSTGAGQTIDLAVQFVTDILLRLPLRICVAVANQVLLEPLSQVVGSAKSKNLIIQACQLPFQQQRLELLGCLLGLPEWTSSMQLRFQFPPACVTEIVADELLGQSGVGIEEEQEVCNEEESDSEESDIDSILSGDEELTEQSKEEDKAEEEKVEETEHLEKEGENEVEDEEESSDEDNDDEEDESDDDDEGDENEEGSEEDRSSPAVSKGNDEAKIAEDEDEGKELTREEKCRRIVDMIRKDEFGVGIQLDEIGQRLMLKQQERQGRSLLRLSKDLYSKDTHFVLELIQNADDNSYTEEITPAIKFLIDETGVMISNNEMGFEEKNIRALCDVGKSTKTKHNIGYIGQKGIGFKSVFRVTGRPEVHSNGFHICFDVKSGPMGYILPHWIEEPEDTEGWQTRIALPWTEEIKQQIHSHAARFNDIQPSLLLFLHRLREITIQNKIENHEMFMRRQDLPDGEVQIVHSHGTDRWLVLRKILDASQVSLQAKSGIEVESTEIALAFPLKDKMHALHSQMRPNKLPVFAFLPLRSYGFRFIVQGDFDVPSSREDVDRDSSWNQWLRDEIHVLFIEAFDAFKARPDLSPIEALSLYLQFIPLEGEVMEFFKPVASQILAQLRAKECMPVLTGDNNIQWKMPSKTVMTHDSLVQEIVSADLLQGLLGLYYLHPDVAAILDSPLTQALGIESITTEHLLHIGKAISQNWDGNTGHVTDLAKWLACVYRSLDDFQDNTQVIKTLCKLNIVPLSNGSLVSLSDVTVFLLTDGHGRPAVDKGKKKTGAVRDPLLELKKDLNLVHSGLTNTEDNEVNSQVVKLLIKMGIKQMTAHDLIHSHIMPVLKSDAWKDKSRDVLISYLVYIKMEMDNNSSVVDRNELRSTARIATNHGIKSPCDDDVHFSKAFGNPVDLQFCLPGIKWTLVDSAYLPHSCTQLEMQSWHDFLSDLGVVDFLRVKKMEQQFDKQNIGETAWAEYKEFWPDSPDGYTIVDFHCQELYSLVTANQRPEKMHEQMEALFEILDVNWGSQYNRLTNTQLKSRSGHVLKDVIQTSFAIHLQTLAWVPSVWESLNIEEDRRTVKVMHEKTLEKPSQLYVAEVDIMNKLAHTVKYLKPTPMKNSTFARFLEIKNSVNVETVKKALISWSERDEGSPNTPRDFSASRDHMHELYFHLNERLPRKDAQDLFHDHPVIFVPVTSPEEWATNKITVGKMMKRTEVWWCDPTQLFVKYQHSLEMYKSPLAKNKILQSFYPKLDDVFLTTARVQTEPNTSDLAALLKHIATVHTLSEEGVLTDVLFLFSKIGSDLSKINDIEIGVPTDSAQRAQLHLPLVLELLSKAAVFPTKLNQWVSLTDHPMIADSSELEEMFFNKPGVHFLQLEAIDKYRDRDATSNRGRRETKNRDSVKYCMSLFEAIKPLSECITTEEITSRFQQCIKGQTYLHNIVGLLQQFLFYVFPDVYEEVKKKKASTLKELIFSQVQKLEVRYQLMHRPDVFEIRQEKCVVKGKHFYFHEQYVNSQVEINREVAKYFSEGNEDCIRQLRNFLSLAVPILERSSEDTIEDLLLRQQVPVRALPPDEEIWEVPLPIIPVAPEPKPVVETMVYGRALSVPGAESAASDGGDGGDGGDGLKSWPPKSGLVKEQVAKSKKDTNKTSSGMWPPPKAPDYVSLSKELPSNIKFQRAVEGDSEKKDGGTTTVEGDQNSARQFSNSGEGRPSRQVSDSGEGKGMARHPSQAGDEKGLNRQTSSASGQGGHTLDGGDGRAAPRQGASRQGSEVETRQSDSMDMADQTQGAEGVSTGEKRKRKLTEGSREDDNVMLKRLNSEDTTNRGPREGDTSAPHERNSARDYDGQRRHNEGHEGRQGPSDRDSSSSREVTPSSSSSNQDQRRQNRQKGMLQFTIPVWNESSEDSAFTELSRDKSLAIPQMKLDQEAQAGEIGQWGEMLVLDYLLRLKAEDASIEAVLWANADGEKGLPYDFEIVFNSAGAEDFCSMFVEVKTTVSWDKEVFQVSSKQIEFALQHKDKYQIYRVFGAGNNSPKLVRIDNVAERMRAHSVHLFMVI